MNGWLIYDEIGAKRNAWFIQKLKEELSVKDNPNKVKPTEKYTTTDGSDDSHYQADNVSGLKESCPSANNLCNPVYTGDEKKQNLNETVLFVEPSHRFILLNKIVS